MKTTRRSFLRTTTGAALGVGLTSGRPTPALAELHRGRVPRARRQLRLLILGGTGFIGPPMVWYAHERGHEVTIFTRGNSRPPLPDDIEWLIGDRNDDLTALEGRDWDVVIDNPTTLPKWVRDSASLLQGHADQYIFVSTLSVYASEDEAWADEDDEVAEYTGDDPYAEEEVTGELYGPLKALSEQEARKWFPGSTTVVRPGLIVGPGDPSDRFTYWPVRVDRGGEILAPPAEDPVQIIDARDLSQWIVRLAEDGVTGTFNATGPEAPLSVGGMLHGIRAVTGGDVSFTFTTAEFLEEQGVRPWRDIPVWIPDTPETAGFSRRSIERALSEGLTFRPLAETVSDLLEWHATRPEEERGLPLRAGLNPEREAELLEAWHGRSSPPESPLEPAPGTPWAPGSSSS